MNTIGFLTIHNPGNPCSKDLNSLLATKQDKEEPLEIIAYLNKGIPVIQFISSLYEKSGELIGPNVICTDGLWIWPGYYSYYLKKYPQILVPEAFKEHVKSNGQREIGLDQNEKKYAEYVIAKMLGVKISDRTIQLSGIGEMIELRGGHVACF
jgi:hypothetical protein